MRVQHHRRPHQFGSKHWTPEDDRRLIEFAMLCAPWNKVTEVFPRRSASACQTRWNNYVRDTLEVNPRLRLDNAKPRDKRNRERLDGGGCHYVLKVPAGDPLLRMLIRIHGKDRIYRNVDVRPVTATRQIWPDQIPSFALAGS